MKKIVFLLFAFFILNSCNNEIDEKIGLPEPEGNFQVPNTILKGYVPEMSKLISKLNENDQKKKEYIEGTMHKLVLIIYKQMKNKNLRERIFSECKLKLDGDYEILLTDFMLRNKDMKNLLILEDENSLKYISNFNSTIQGLQISVPVNIDKWDFKNKQLLVGYAPLDENEPIRCHYNNKQVFLDPKNEPNEPVVIISMSERLNKNKTQKQNVFSKKTLVPGIPTVGNGVSKSLQLNWTGENVSEVGYEIYRNQANVGFQYLTEVPANFNFYLDPNLTPGVLYTYVVRSKLSDGTTTDFSLPGGTRASDRVDYEKLKIGSFKFNSNSALKKYESWARGAPELKFKLYGGDFNSTIKLYSDSRIFEPNTRKDACDGFDIDFDAIDWLAKYNIITIIWIEDDGDFLALNNNYTVNGKFEYKFKIDGNDVGTISTSPSATYGVSETDDVIDNDLGTNIYFWNAKGHTYDSGDVTFTIK